MKLSSRLASGTQLDPGDVGEASISILIIDDETEVAEAMVRRLQAHAFVVTIFADATLALGYLTDHLDEFDVILLDIGMPISGLEVLARIKLLDCPTPVVMWTGDARALTATSAMRAGAFSYTTKPVARPDEFIALLRSAASFGELARRTRALERRVADAERRSRPIGQSRPMCALQRRIEKLASSDITILILGESGTGKEIVARSIHDHSDRSHEPFVAINCGAISESMIDSELFGHSRGAFTGAVAARSGLFVEADGGTVFLDEIAELPLSVQARLLRVLQEREVRPVGGDGVRAVDVRVLAATHQSLTAAVESKRFREDLYYRINVATVEVPPLRERMSDVPLLAAHFLRMHGGSRDVQLTPAALEALMSNAWPGNVRELENALLLALALTSGDTIDVVSLPALVMAARDRSSVPEEPRGDLAWAQELSLTDAKKRASEDFERRYVTNALARAHGNLTEAARISGLDRSNFRRVLTRLGIDVGAFRDN